MSADALADGNARPAPPEKPGVTEPAPAEFPPLARARHLHCPHCHNPIELIEEDRSDEVLCPGCGSSFRLSGEPRLTTGFDDSRCLGKFQLYEQVGQGAFGAVWRARDTELDRAVALKIPHAGRLDSPAETERFHREARAAAQLRHPNIVTIHEVTTLQGVPVIVSDYISGMTLKDLLEVRRLTFREAALLAARVAEALDYAHNRGLVHRDIKPANIMVEPAAAGGHDGEGGVGRPLLLDFGLALREEAEIAITMDGQILGTPAYISPEQAAGRGHHVDRRSDVYSLGVVLYELLTGELPFRGSKLMLVQQALYEEPRPPRRVKESVPRDLETICLKCLRKEPHKRYASAAELAGDLRRFLNGEPIRARPVARVERLWRWCRRNRLVASLLAAVVVIFLGGFAGVTWQWLRAEAYSARLVEEEANKLQRLEEVYTAFTHSLDAGVKAFEQKDYQQARLAFTDALARLEAEPDLPATRRTDLGRRATAWLDRARREIILREAERQRAEKLAQAQAAVKEFRRLAGEAQFHAAGTDAVAERAPYYDPRRAAGLARSALDLARAWGPGLRTLPLPKEECAGLRKELFGLLLLLAQAELQHASEPATGEEVLALLRCAASLGEPLSRDYHRLQAESYRLLGDGAKAAEESRQADNARGKVTALDHFLLGERCRMEALGRVAVPAEGPAWQPDRALLQKACDAYRDALALEPAHAWAHFQLGRCYLTLGQGDKAVAALQTFVALRPNSPWGYSARGLALGLMKRFPEAERDLNHALSLQREAFYPARLNLGVVCWLQKKNAEALAHFDAVLKAPAAKRLGEAAYYRGQLHLECGRYAEALKDFDQVVADNPAFRPVHLLRAQTHLLQGQGALCLKDLDAFLASSGQTGTGGRETDGQRSRLLCQLVLNLPPTRRKECTPLALAEFQRAVDRGSRSAPLCQDIGAFLEALGYVPEAINAYSKGLEHAPKDGKLLMRRGTAHERAGQYEQAEADFARVVRLDASNAEALSRLGYVHACRKAHAEAQREALEALVRGGGDYLVLHNVACIYARLSQSDEGQAAAHQATAVALLRRAVDLWRGGGEGPSEVELIRQEPAFRISSLGSRPDFNKLLEGGD